jgi:hypothetical protein
MNTSLGAFHDVMHICAIQKALENVVRWHEGELLLRAVW